MKIGRNQVFFTHKTVTYFCSEADGFLKNPSGVQKNIKGTKTGSISKYQKRHIFIRPALVPYKEKALYISWLMAFNFMKTQNTISIRLKNDLKDLKRLNKTLAVLEKQLDLTSKCHCQLNIILEEIFTNILKYAFTDKSTHFIDIRIAYEKEFLSIQVEDDGHPFNPFEAKKPNLDAPLEERDIGGLGVFFIKQFADEIIYKRKKNKNYIALKKKIDQNG